MVPPGEACSTHIKLATLSDLKSLIEDRQRAEDVLSLSEVKEDVVIDMVDQLGNLGITVEPLSELKSASPINAGSTVSFRAAKAASSPGVIRLVDREDRVIVDAPGAEPITCASQRIPGSVGAGRDPGELGFELRH